MNDVTINESRVKFSAPDSKTNIIKVTRTLPDGTEEPIGQIYADFGEGTDSMQYYSSTLTGEELLPPTADFIDIEREFEKSLRYIEQRSFENGIAEKMEEYERRNEEVQELRQTKTKAIHKVLKR